MPGSIWILITVILVIGGTLVPWWPVRTPAICVGSLLFLFSFYQLIWKAKDEYALRFFCLILASLFAIIGSAFQVYLVFEKIDSTQLVIQFGASAAMTVLYVWLSDRSLRALTEP